jgi:outer membrane immunogenic protein
MMLGGVPAANSADLELDTYPDTPVSGDRWTGVYLGLHGTKMYSEGNVELDKYSGFLIPLDVQNGLFAKDEGELRGTLGGGLTLGYNQQFGQFVLGVEGDITLARLGVKHYRARIDPNPMIPFFGQNVLSNYSTQFENLATLRVRAGWSLENTLLYLTGGLAASTVKNEFGIAIPGLGYSSPEWSESGLAWGYVVGAGVEHKLTRNISLKAEALFVDLEDRVVKGRDPVSFPGEFISYEFDNTLAIGRVGLNYAF